MRRGGVLTTQLNGEQRVLNPAIRASTGVYIMTSKMMEALVDLDAAGKPYARAGDELGRDAGREDRSPSSCARA